MDTPERLHRLAVDGGTIEYSDRGAGEAVVLLNAGLYADWFVLVAARPELDRLRVVRVRRAGYADGPPPDRHLTIEDHAAHVEALLRSLELPRVHLCGHSSSAFVALQFALDHPDAVASMVLLEPALGGILEGPVAAGFARATVLPARERAMSGDVAGAFDIWMRGVGGPRYAEVVEGALGPGTQEAMLRQSRFFFSDEGPAVREWDFDAARAGSIGQPVLLVQGERTVEPFQAMVRLLADLLPAAETLTVPEADHLMPLGHPGALAAAIAGYVARHPAGGPATQPSRS